MAQRLRLTEAKRTVIPSKEDSAVEKQKSPNKPPKDQSKKLPVRPGERSDEESIGRPVQLDKDQHEPRPPGESHREDRPRTEPAGTA